MKDGEKEKMLIKGIRLCAAFLLCSAAATSRLWLPETARQYASEVRAVVCGDADFEGAAEAIRAWLDGETTGSAAFAEAAADLFRPGLFREKRY